MTAKSLRRTAVIKDFLEEVNEGNYCSNPSKRKPNADSGPSCAFVRGRMHPLQQGTDRPGKNPDDNSCESRSYGRTNQSDNRRPGFFNRGLQRPPQERENTVKRCRISVPP